MYVCVRMCVYVYIYIYTCIYVNYVFTRYAIVYVYHSYDMGMICYTMLHDIVS